MKQMPLDIGPIHFIGIGGIGMSGIADVLVSLGYNVQGSDLSENTNVQRLKKKGVQVFKGHQQSNIDGVSLVVISSAVGDENVELASARSRKIPVVRRAEMLAELTRLKWSIAVAGSHGKTTTTSLVGHIMDVAQLDPTVINGGIINSYGTNTRLGKSDWMVVEADESDGTFTRLPATAAIVTNLDPEHLDHYGSFDNIKKAFQRFVENVPFYGFGVLCIDHPEVQKIIAKIKDKRVITYGFSAQADIRATNLSFDIEGAKFDVSIASWLTGDGEKQFKDLKLPMHGEHNVLNALAAVSVAVEMNIAQAHIRKGLSSFSGVKRRFTKVGSVNGYTIIDDYAHHPVEIEAVLKAARKIADQQKGLIIAIKQPHR